MSLVTAEYAALPARPLGFPPPPGLQANRIETSNGAFDDMLRRALADLCPLMTDGPAATHGLHAVSGRSALICAFETLWYCPRHARSVLLHLAERQASEFDPYDIAEPGKIPQEIGDVARAAPLASARRSYASIDTTPLFVMLAGAYFRRTGDARLMARLWPNIERALAWIRDYGDRDGDGFVEYGRRSGEGLANQAWKDSPRAVFHADGTLAEGPIAIAEVQAYVYGAWRAAAHIAQGTGNPALAVRYERNAQLLRDDFDAHFFDEGLGTYVLALDGEKHPCRVRASNAGHALFAGIAYPERAAKVAQTLMDRSFFSGWGVRTLADTETGYDPLYEHNGAIWPHDNALIAAGLAHYGYRREAARIFEGLFAAARIPGSPRLPALFCGFPRARRRGPSPHPAAGLTQDWTAAAPLFLLSLSLGLTFDPGRRQLSFDEPVLPDFLDTVTLRHLALGEAWADVLLRRSGAHVCVELLDRQGDLRVLTTI